MTGALQNIWFEQKGHGIPLLYLHGLGESNQWGEFLNYLSQKTSVMFPNHPGFGASPFQSGIRTVKDLAMLYKQFMDNVLKDTGQEKYAVVGSSLGGWIGAELACADSARISHLVLMDPAGIPPKEGLLRRDTLSQGLDDVMKDVSSRLESINGIEQMAKALAVMIRNRTTFGYLAAENGMGDHSLLDRLKKMEINSFLIWGENDRVIDPRYSEFWRESLSARTAFFPAGHTPHKEFPDVVSQKVLEFILTK